MTKKIYTSNIPRAYKTGEIVQSTLKDLGQDISLRIRDMFSYTNPEWFAPEVDKERKSVQNSPVSENELVQDFLDGKRENKPATLAKPYLQKMKQVFERVTKAKESLTIIAFRHGDKTPEGDLSETGEKQAKQLGETLKTRDEQTMHTLYIATHNTINESIVRMLISTEQLPKEWRTPLNFAEPVIYRFHADIPDQEPTLEIERRGIKKQILFDDLKQILA